jgi:uncharacterized protein (TIGR00266 family)
MIMQTEIQHTQSSSMTEVTSSSQPGFSHYVEAAPDFAYLTVKLNAGDTVKVEASAMATMTPNLKMSTKARGGLSRLLTGESIFINEFTAEHGPGQIEIAPAAPGDLTHFYLDQESIYLQSSAFLASSTGVNVDSNFQGMRGFFSGEGLFLARCHGIGDLWFNTYGGLIKREVDGEYIVDTGHMVAFTEGLDYKVESIGGLKSFFLSGEGLVCRFSGRGTVWIQTRNLSPFLGWLRPFRPQKRSNE